MNKTVFVTGVGIISGLGYGRRVTMEALREHRSAIAKIRYLDTTLDLPVSEVPYSNEEMMDMLNIHHDAIMTRTALIGKLALKEAIEVASLNPSDQRTVFISGTTVGGMDKTEQYYLNFLHNDNNKEYIKTHDCGICSVMIAEDYHGFEMMTTLSAACSSAANAIQIGMELIQSGRCDVAVVGGSECISKYHLNGFNSLMILDKEQCRPFDSTRAGINLGEGAGYLVIESEESVKKRNIKPLCVLSSCANRCDAFHQTASSPNGEGAYLAMIDALKEAGLQASDIDYVNAHGTGTQGNDLSEGNALMRVFGDNMPYVASLKSYIGHTTSAVGGVEGVISVLSLLEGYIPISLNYRNKIEEHSFEPLHHDTIPHRLEHIMSNSFGFGGNDTVCIFSKIKEDKI